MSNNSLKGGNVNINVGDKQKEGFYAGSASNVLRVAVLGLVLVGFLAFYMGVRLGQLEHRVEVLEYEISRGAKNN